MAATTTLVGNDGVNMEFGDTHIKQMAYISHILEDDDAGGAGGAAGGAAGALNTFEVAVASSKILLLLKDLLTLKDTTGVQFKQEARTKTYRGITTKVPPYAGADDPWDTTAAAGTYYTYLTKIPVEDLCQLFILADYLICDDILHGIAYILIQHMLNYTGDVRQILKSTAPHAAHILGKIHVANVQ